MHDIDRKRASQLRDEIDRAYAVARVEVFDVEGPTSDRSNRTLRQRRLVEELERLETELKQLRES